MDILSGVCDSVEEMEWTTHKVGWKRRAENIFVVGTSFVMLSRAIKRLEGLDSLSFRKAERREFIVSMTAVVAGKQMGDVKC